MERQLKIYDYLDVLLQENKRKQWFVNVKLNYFVSDIMDKLHIDNALEIEASLNRTFAVCSAVPISLNENFIKIYCFDGESLRIDWKISALACYLLIINCNPSNEFVARAQLHFGQSGFTSYSK